MRGLSLHPERSLDGGPGARVRVITERAGEPPDALKFVCAAEICSLITAALLLDRSQTPARIACTSIGWSTKVQVTR